MNVDSVIVTTLVDKTAEADDVAGHGWVMIMMGMVNMMMVMKKMKKVNGRMKMKILMMTMMKIRYCKVVMMTMTMYATMID